MGKAIKKIIKVVGIAILIIIGLIVLIIGFLIVKNQIESKKPWLSINYYENFKSDLPLEKKYSGLGGFAVSNTVIKADDNVIGNYRVWYPAELENSTHTYPLITVTNASNMAALNYEEFFRRLSSWGFIVAGNDDRQSGTGASTSKTLDYMLSLNENSESILNNKIDVENIGIVGYSQGGSGALRAVTEFDNSDKFKAIFTGSAAHSYLAQMWGGYDASKVLIPWFMTAGTGMSDDAGAGYVTAEWSGVAPLSSLIENFNAMSDDVIKIRARVVSAEHEEMQQKTDDYMTAWMLYHLCGDNEAGKAFTGDDPEIVRNENWQDIDVKNAKS